MFIACVDRSKPSVESGPDEPNRVFFTPQECAI